jgi:hypothetical protein
MSTKTTFKRIALVAVAALGFGMLSVVSANATAITQAYSVSGASNASTTPTAQGVAVALTISVTTTGTITNAVTIGINPTFVILDPNGVVVTTGVYTATGNQSLATNNTVTGSAVASTLTAGAGAASTLATLAFTPTMGGIYTMTVTAPAGVASATDTMAALAAGTVVTGSIHISGVNVSQGTTRGNPGNARLGNQAQVFVLLPANPNSLTPTYKFVSSGAGTITGATAVNASSVPNISGVSTDFSAGTTLVRTNNTTLTTQRLTLTNAATAGVQTITVTTVDAATGLSSALYSTTITWTGTPALSPTISIVRIAPAGTTGVAQLSTAANTGYSTTVDAIPYSAPKAIATNVAQVQVILLNSDGTAATGGHTVTASVSGSGFVLTDVSSAAANGTARSEGQTLTAGSENVAFIHISGDGTAGTGTINISVTDVATGATTVLPSKTVTFTGSVASLTVSTTNFTIGKAGVATGAAAAARNTAGEVTNAGALNTSTTTPAFIVSTKDSGGRLVTSTAAPTVVSSDALVLTGGTCILDNGLDADYSSTVASAGGTNGVGVYNCNFSTASIAKSGDKATLTIRVSDPASTTGGYLTTTLAVTVGGSASTETIAFNKESYEPGEAMLITRTAKDSAGNPVADGTAAPAIRFSKSVGGTTPAASLYLGGVSASASSLAKSAVFAPTSIGAFSALATSGNAAASALTATATVAGDTTTSDAANAAADAAAEATDAANAATDAANAAAEAADAATAAAQDAADAVAALSTQVAELISDLRKQITSLTNLVIKIQKKVKA